MRYEVLLPSDELRNYIRCFWVLESNLPYIHHALADVCPELVFHYGGQFDEIHDEGKTKPSFTSGVQGPCSRTRKFQIDRSFGIFGVYFYPHAIPLVFDRPATEFTNEAIDLKTLLSDYGQALEERILAAETVSERVRIISDFVTVRLTRHVHLGLPVFQAITDIIHGNASTRIKQLATHYYLSERQFERRFQQFAGLTPKLFCRIARFHSTLSFYRCKNIRLTDIATNCGYYDQSHFIHDFTAFSGHHPKAYFSGATEATAWRD